MSRLPLLETHDGSIQQPENCRLIDDLFVTAMHVEGYRELRPDNNVVSVTDNAPAHSGVEGVV